MAAALTVTLVDAAPGNIVTIPGSNLTGGGPANVKLSNQGVNAPPGLAPAPLTLAAVFNGTNVQVTIPDGITDGTLTITASDSSTATCLLRACSQYVQASEYLGEGTDVSGFATGELDIILRRASVYADTYMGAPVRLLQVLERHKYRASDEQPPRIRPFRVRGREVPIISVDQLVFVSAKDLVTAFDVDDMYVNTTLNYIEILAYAVGNYALLGALEVIGYSANVFELAYTSGFSYGTYPAALRAAVIMIATELITYRQLQNFGLGALDSFNKNQMVRRKEPFAIPLPARELLAPFCALSLA